MKRVQGPGGLRDKGDCGNCMLVRSSREDGRDPQTCEGREGLVRMAHEEMEATGSMRGLGSTGKGKHT